MKINKKMYVVGALIMAGQMFYSVQISLPTIYEAEGEYQPSQYEQELPMDEEMLQLDEDMPADEDMLSEDEQGFFPETQEQFEEYNNEGEDQFAQYEDEQPLDDEQQMEEETYPQDQEN